MRVGRDEVKGHPDYIGAGAASHAGGGGAIVQAATRIDEPPTPRSA